MRTGWRNALGVWVERNSEIVIRIDQVCFGYGQTPVLLDVSTAIPTGCVCGLIGANGVGKTTLIKILLGRLLPHSGSVSVFGLDPAQSPAEVLGRLGYLSENRDLPNWMRVGECIAYMQAFYPNWDPNYAKELQNAFVLKTDQPVDSLSRGQRARLGLLVALAHRPPLLILDEPSAGLDAVVRRDILNAVIRVAADEGRTVLFSSHLLGELERVSDRVLFLEDASVAMDASVPELLKSYVQFAIRMPQVTSDWHSELETVSAINVGDEWDVIVKIQHEQPLLDRLEELDADVIRKQMPSLEELFVAFSRRGENEVV